LPHIVLENVQSLKESYDSVPMIVQKLEKGILKITDKYINHKDESALFESVVVEDGKSQRFFVQISNHKKGITVRLLPLTDPEKTDGVKKLMGMIAYDIKQLNDDIQYGKTNLQDFLIQ
jgi:hypothetical protein